MNELEKIILPIMKPESVAREIEDFIIQEVLKTGFSGAVLGLSGGVDSTTVAALTKSAFDRYNSENKGKKLELVGYILPSSTNSPKDAEDGKKVAERLGIRYETISIDKVVEAYRTTNPEAFEATYHKGNLMSRIRANILSTKAASQKKLVMGTGNKDEDFGIGYYTLFGDGAVHLSPIGNLPKRLVREMARYKGFGDLADRIPTAGLEPGQTDFKDLGYSYDLVELVTEGFSQGFDYDKLVRSKQVSLIISKEISQYKQMFGREKFNCPEELVADIMKRHAVAQAKTRVIHPPAAQVTLDYEGINARYKRNGYTGPISTTDTIIEYDNGEKQGLVLITRKNKPYGIALPGGFAEKGITLDENAKKEAKEETGLDIQIENPEKPFCVHSKPNRDPRDHMISITYIAKGSGQLRAGDDAKTATLYTIPEIKEMLRTVPFAFDHEAILKKYFEHKGY